jgi:hypothetical protein
MDTQVPVSSTEEIARVLIRNAKTLLYKYKELADEGCAIYIQNYEKRIAKCEKDLFANHAKAKVTDNVTNDFTEKTPTKSVDTDKQIAQPIEEASPLQLIISNQYYSSGNTYVFNMEKHFDTPVLAFNTIVKGNESNVGYKYQCVSPNIKTDPFAIQIVMANVNATKVPLRVKVILDDGCGPRSCDIFGKFSFPIMSGICYPLGEHNVLNNSARIGSYPDVVPTKFFKLTNDVSQSNNNQQVLVRFDNGSFYRAGPECLFIVHDVPQCTIKKGITVRKEKTFGVLEEFVLSEDVIVRLKIDQ